MASWILLVLRCRVTSSQHDKAYISVPGCKFAARYAIIGLITSSVENCDSETIFNVSIIQGTDSEGYQSVWRAKMNLRMIFILPRRCLILNFLYLLVRRSIENCSRWACWISVFVWAQSCRSSAMARYATVLMTVD